MLVKAFDGEVYCWYEDDPAVRSEMSRVDPLRFTNAKIYTQADLDQARKEARKAALRGAANTIYAMSRIEARHQSVEFLNGAAWMQDKAAKLIESTIEAAANTEEGGGDGTSK